jgi:hypothetical protein
MEGEHLPPPPGPEPYSQAPAVSPSLLKSARGSSAEGRSCRQCVSSCSPFEGLGGPPDLRPRGVLTSQRRRSGSNRAHGDRRHPARRASLRPPGPTRSSGRGRPVSRHSAPRYAGSPGGGSPSSSCSPPSGRRPEAIGAKRLGTQRPSLPPAREPLVPNLQVEQVRLGDLPHL